MDKPTTSAFPLRLPADIYGMLKAESFATGRSINAIINDAVTTHLHENRSELIDRIGRAASERYSVILDKLADL